MVLTFPHEHRKYSPTCVTILIENQLEPGRKTPVSLTVLRDCKKDPYGTG